jgi:hypothetical protein
LKKEYKQFSEKYNLPEFSDLNKIFDIEEVDSEGEFLLRKIRRVISEKVANYLRFVELMLNPSNAPMFFFKLVNKLDEEDKMVLSQIYEKLGSLEIEIIGLDLDYNEKKEAEFISKIYDFFNREVKGYLLKIIEKLGNGEGKKRETGSSYCG